jgi:hypothetical protein
MDEADVSATSGDCARGIAGDAEALPSLDSPAGTLSERRTLRARLAAQGVEVYEDLLEFLSNEISAAEADEARVAFGRSLKALGWAALGLLIFAGLPFQVARFSDFILAASIVAALVLVSRYHILFAGRLILVSVALLALHSPARESLDLFSDAPKIVPILLTGLVVGMLIDTGASADPERKHPRLRYGLLTLTGALISWQAWESQFWITCTAGLMVCVWGWWPARWLEARSRLRKEDSETIRLLAMKRWAFVAWGRFFAVTVSLFPFLLFLHNIGLNDHLRLPADDRTFVKTSIADRKLLWYWPSHAAYLRVSDLAEESFYGIPQTELGTVEPLMEDLKAANRGEGRKKPSEVYALLVEALKKYRLDSPSKFEEFQKRNDAKRLLHLVAPPPGSPLGLLRRYRVEDLSGGSGMPLSAMEPAGVADLLSHNALWQWLLVGYGLLGFTILWRRGGDSRLGWWIGLWVVTVGGLGSFRYTSYFLTAFNYRALDSAELPGEILLCTILNLLVLVASAASLLFVLFVPCAAIWTHACWPTLRADGTRRQGSRFITVCKIGWVALCMSVLFYVPFILAATTEALEPVWAAVLAMSAFAAASVVFGVLFRRRKSQLDQQPEISETAGILLFLVQGTVTCSLLAELWGDDPSLARNLTVASFVAGIGFLLFVVILIFRKDFLYLSAARDFSFAIAALIPVLVAWSEEFSSSFANRLTLGLIPERGNEIVAVVLAVGMLPPARRWIERRLLYLSQPGLQERERKIHATLEELPDLWSLESLAEIRKLLQEIGLDGAKLFVRSGRDRFSFTATRESFELSPSLRRFLVSREGFLELSRLAFEWRYFFVQFELHRIRRATESRFLLPIVVGGSLRALLLIPESPHHRRLGEAMTEEIEKLGLITALFRDGDPSEAPPANP